MIRIANINDLKSINKLRIALNDEHVFNEKNIFKDNIDNEINQDTIDSINGNTSNIYVFELDNQIVAFALIKQQEYPETFDKYLQKVFYIQEFLVDKNYRRRGIGRQLFDYLKKEAKKKGYSRLELDVWNFNQGAIDFYNRIGYKAYRTYMYMGIEDE